MLAHKRSAMSLTLITSDPKKPPPHSFDIILHAYRGWGWDEYAQPACRLPENETVCLKLVPLLKNHISPKKAIQVCCFLYIESQKNKLLFIITGLLYLTICIWNFTHWSHCCVQWLKSSKKFILHQGYHLISQHMTQKDYHEGKEDSQSICKLLLKTNMAA